MKRWSRCVASGLVALFLFGAESVARAVDHMGTDDVARVDIEPGVIRVDDVPSVAFEVVDDWTIELWSGE